MVKLINGDSIEVLKTLEPCSIDAVVCDPPYGLGNTSPSQVAECLQSWSRGEVWRPKGSGFMGKAWDAWVPPPQLWKEVFRVLKHGGHLIAFAGSRTQDLMSISLRLAGFEVRDVIQWLYGSGFPKSHNIGKALGDKEEAKEWEGWGTALKPAYEPAILCRKPIEGSVAQNVLKHGVGGINIDGCRIGEEERTYKGSGVNRIYNPLNRIEKKNLTIFAVGRWPSNVILDEEASQLLDKQTGILKSGSMSKRTGGIWATGGISQSVDIKANQGGASRFFYCAKASRQEREKGLETLAGVGALRDGGRQSQARSNIHPTVKPIDLMRYLCRLITPPKGVVLDPFMGSGSTGIGAGLEGFDFVGIEREEEYFNIAKARIEHWVNTPLTYDSPPPKKEVKQGEQMSLF